MFVRLSYFITFISWSVALTISQKRSDFDTVEHGPYTIVNCGTPNAAKIATSLDNLATYLTPAIKDANRSDIIPSRAYTTFFKDRASASFVSNILTNVSSGPTMYPLNYYSNGAPIFACLDGAGELFYDDADSGQKFDAFKQCQQDPSLASFTIANSSYIVICPSFFTASPTQGIQQSGYPTSVPAPEQALAATDCLKVNALTDDFIGTGTSLTMSMPWLLLEEIANYYIFATTKVTGSMANGTYDVNLCVGLNSRQCVQNAHNFVYYVANIYSQCTDFPTNSTTITTQGRETLSTVESATNATTDTTYPVGIVNGMTDVVLGGHSSHAGNPIVGISTLTYTTTVP